MYYEDIQKVIEEQEIEQGDKITILFKNSAYNNKNSKVPPVSRIEGTFEKLDTQYFIYFKKKDGKKDYKVLSRVKGIEKITCQTKSQ